MFGLPGELTIAIPARRRFFSLYAAGPFERKLFVPETQTTYLAYPRGAAIALFYTYPSHRAAALVRNDGTADGADAAAFPGLSKPVRALFQVRASKTDRLRRALARLNEQHGGAFSFSDDFYARLAFLISKPGKLNYLDLDSLADRFQNQPSSGD